MVPARTLLAALIVLAVALLPATGGAAGIKPVHASSHAAMVDGCDDPPGPCPVGGPDGCTSMAACAVECFASTSDFAVPVSWPGPTLPCIFETREAICP